MENNIYEEKFWLLQLGYQGFNAYQKEFFLMRQSESEMDALVGLILSADAEDDTRTFGYRAVDNEYVADRIAADPFDSYPVSYVADLTVTLKNEHQQMADELFEIDEDARGYLTFAGQCSFKFGMLSGQRKEFARFMKEMGIEMEFQYIFNAEWLLVKES